MFQSLVIICTGNICRSPYAEYVFKSQTDKVAVSSVGLSALVGSGADDTALQVALTRNVDMRAHVAKQIDTSNVAHADLILVMEDIHLQKVMKRYPEARGKTFKLGKWLDDKNIADPYKKPASFFSLVYDEIDACVATWLKHIT